MFRYLLCVFPSLIVCCLALVACFLALVVCFPALDVYFSAIVARFPVTCACWSALIGWYIVFFLPFACCDWLHAITLIISSMQLA